MVDSYENALVLENLYGFTMDIIQSVTVYMSTAITFVLLKIIYFYLKKKLINYWATIIIL